MGRGAGFDLWTKATEKRDMGAVRSMKSAETME